jgi:hypothetical protein
LPVEVETSAILAPVITPRRIRGFVLLWCAGGIAGMIVTSINDSIDGAITFGLLTAAAVLCLILVTAVAGRDAFAAPGEPDPDHAAHVERQIAALVRDGVDESRVRRLAKDAVALGREMAVDRDGRAPER